MAAHVPTADEDAIRLRRIMLAATVRTRNEILDPPGGNDSAKAFNVSRAAAQLSDLEKYLATQNVAAQGILDRQVHAQYAAGDRRAERLVRAAGLVPADSPVGAAFAGADTARAAVLSRTYRDDLNKAFDSMGVVAGRSIREVHALGMKNAQLRRILAGGVISGMPQETRAKVAKLAEQAAIGGFVEIPNKRTGRVTRIRPEAYADLVYQTATREATNIAELERLHARQSFYVKIIGSNSTNFCTVYRGKVFYFGPGDDPLGAFPHLRSLPHGGAPFHPRCTKAYVPFNPRSASAREFEAAKPTRDVLDTVGKSSSDAQRAFEDAEKRKTDEPSTPRSAVPTPKLSTVRDDEPVTVVSRIERPQGERILPTSAAQAAAAVARVDRSSVVVPEVRAVVDAGLAEIAATGRQLPRTVRQLHPESRRSSDPPATVRPAEREVIQVQPRWPEWTRAAAFAQEQHAAGRWSTPRPAHPIYVAVGRSDLATRVGVEQYRALDAMPLLRVATIADSTAIAAALGTQAILSPAGFVAEVYARLVAGLDVPPKILQLFHTLGGL